MKKLKIVYALICVVCIVSVGTGYVFKTSETLSKYGSRGDEVTKIQQRLSDLGYSVGKIDGVYGWKTQDAVYRYQLVNGLKADGVAGKQTLSMLGISSGASASTGAVSNNTQLLAQIINGEARGESFEGQIAVGAVVLNRVKHPSFPNTIAGVIFQPGAFEALTAGQWDVAVTESSYKAANSALNGWDPTGGAIYYYNPAKTSNKWIRTRPVVATIGKHVFAK